MEKYEIDKVAEAILIGKSQNLYTKITDDIKQRVLNISFDCTPNWGIVGASDCLEKENWYFLDERLKSGCLERIKLLDLGKIKNLLPKIMVDIVGENVKIEGFSIYGSYLYSQDNQPNDLDILVLVSGITGLTYDALKYPIQSRDLFIKDFQLNSDELGLTIISIDQLNKINKNYIVTDSALVDKGTSFTIGKGINSKKIPNFILNQNALKLINWGIANLYDNEETLIKRIKEALFMREYMIQRGNNLKLKSINKADILDNIQSKSKDEMLKMSFQIADILKEDEQNIRKNAILNLK